MSLALLITAVSPISLHAQALYGSIVGTVTDGSGAIIQGATVTITDIATNETRTAQSNSAGEYSFVSLVPSTYQVAIEKTSFKRFVREQVTVQVNTTVRIDATLDVGNVTETVEVSTDSPLLQTDSGTLGQVIEGKTVTEMPLNGRNVMNLLSLAPGVVPGNNTQGSPMMNSGGHTQVGGWDNYQIGGGIPGQSAFYLDGQTLNVLGGNTIAYVPVQDSIQEFDVSTNAVSSEFGRFAGGVVSMATKSGTNGWHGSAYEFLRNNVLNSNEFFNKQAELANGEPNTRTQWDQNQYGVTFGGPIKKDKAFFFFSWENYVARTATNNSASVPTPDMQAGWIDAQNGVSEQPLVASLQQFCPAATLGTSPNGTANSAYIPASCWDPTAAVVKTEWPGPLNPVGPENFNKPGTTGTNTSSYTGRVDYNLSARQRLFARFADVRTADLSQDAIPGGVCPSSVCGSTVDWHIGGGATHVRVESGVLGDTFTFNPTTILDVRLSAMRAYNDQVPDSAGIDMSVYKGTWPNLQKEISITNDPQVNFNGTDIPNGVSPFRGNNQISYQWNDNEGLTVNLTKIIGTHSLRLGGEGRYMDRAILQASGNAESSGSFDFNTTYSTLDPTHFVNSSWANFLLGLASDGTISTTRETGASNWYQGYYVNDSWQATRKLTLTAGVRWELPGNIKEKRNRMIELLPTVTDAYTGAYGTVGLVDSSLYADSGSEPARHNLFAPRVGFAYRLTDNDVVRGGYAFDITPPDIQSGLFPDADSINVNSTYWSAMNNQFYTLSNPFPTGINQPLGRDNFSTSVSELLHENVSAPLPQKNFPYTEQWNLSVSHQFRGDWMFEVGYAASVGTHLPMSGLNYNQLAPAYWADQAVPTTANCGGTALWAWTGTTLGQCLRPHPAYLNFADAVANIGSNNYNSLPVRLEKRFRSGGLVTASYTWSKMIGNTEGSSTNQSGPAQNNYDLGAERSVSVSNPSQRLAISYVVNLPFGKGQKFLNGVQNSIVQGLLSGWSLNGITTFQAGLPLGLTATYPGGPNITPTINIPATYGGGALRPNYVGGCQKMVGGSVLSHVLANTPVLNAACWSSPVAATDFVYNGTYYATTVGNEPRVDDGVRAPGQDNWDFAAQKTTKIAERASLEFRMEFFNIFNRVQFGEPATTIPVAQGFGGSTAFGIINDSSLYENQPREGQASLRLIF